ncbi:phytosulfokines-like [Diospyros lotus]|uniref:phytosulfokines-like n=1 Tax=Diospyros lotus TaxID=55363 RepID=UPI00225119B8|nr:phytosulfokines-like [Diospyros lotus]
MRSKKMSKVSAFCTVAILLLFVLTPAAARPVPAFPGDAQAAKTQHEVVDGAELEESCQGVGEEECLIRRTLTAHLDYIYTQKQKQP